MAQPSGGRRDPRQYRARSRPTVELDRGRVVAAAEEVALLRQLGLDRLEGALAFAGGEVVREAGPRCTRRIPGPDGALYLKTHRAVPPMRRLAFAGRLSASPARREWDALMEMRRTGFDVPDPVALGETPTVVGCPPQSFLVTREVPGRTLEELLREGWPDPHGLGPRRARDAVLADLGGMVRRFHAAGFFHKDLYCCHLVVAPDPRWGRPYFIDLQRVERAHPPRRRWLVKDLAALHHSAPPTVTRSDRLRFLLQYLCKSRLDPRARRCARDVIAKARSLAAHLPRYG